MKTNSIDILTIAETRAKGLLILSLSRRDDLALQETGDIGYDFLARVIEDGSLNTNRMFWIEVKASVKEAHGPRVTLSAPQAVSYAESALPLCLFFYAMNDDVGYYAWMVQPTVTPLGTPELVVNSRLLQDRSAAIEFESVDFTKIGNDSVERLINEVNAWYDARHTYLEAA